MGDPSILLGDDSSEDTPLIHPDNDVVGKRIRDLQIQLPCQSVIFAFVCVVVAMSIDKPGVNDEPAQNEYCMPLLHWMTTYLILAAVQLVLAILLVANCCGRTCAEMLVWLHFLVAFCNFANLIWGVIVIIQTDMVTCDKLLYWTALSILIIIPGISCCVFCVGIVFVAGVAVGKSTDDDDGPEATPDLAAAAEEAKMVEGNVRDKCPVCLEDKLVQFANPCGHPICKECQEDMLSREGRELGVKKCPTCRKTVNFFQGVYTVQPGSNSNLKPAPDYGAAQPQPATAKDPSTAAPPRPDGDDDPMLAQTV